MQDDGTPGSSRMREPMIGRLLLLAFGLGVLGFLVAVDRAEWFSIRPATSTSIAMASASSHGQHMHERASARR